MKLNNKGMTLIELLISIALISIIITFLYKIINDVNNTKKNPNFAVNNQVNRAEVIRTVEEDIINLKLRHYSRLNDKAIQLDFVDNSSKAISVLPNQKQISYYNVGGSNMKSWDMKDENFRFGNIIIDEMSESGYVRFIIPVSSPLANENPIDDIEILAKIY